MLYLHFTNVLMKFLPLALDSIGVKMASQLVSHVANCPGQVSLNKARIKTTW